LEGTKELAYEGVKKGAYILSECEGGSPEVILIATGSEVQLALKAQKDLLERGIETRVVSMPSWDRFEAQDESYKEKVLPSDVTKRVSIEMASTLGWERYTGNQSSVIGIDIFGASAKGEKVIEEYG